MRELSHQLEHRESLQSSLVRVAEAIRDLQEAAIGIGKLCFIDPQKEHPELFPESTEPEIGFTDAVREVFRGLERGRFLGPVDVRDALMETGFPVRKYKNPLASIHTTRA